MICPTCQEEVTKPCRLDSRNISNYICHHCKNPFTIWEDIKMGDYVMEWRRYRIYCDNKNKCAQLQKVYMDIESDTSISYRWYTVLELPSIPQNLNEENVEQKIKMYLLFS